MANTNGHVTHSIRQVCAPWPGVSRGHLQTDQEGAKPPFTCKRGGGCQHKQDKAKRERKETDPNNELRRRAATAARSTPHSCLQARGGRRAPGRGRGRASARACEKRNKRRTNPRQKRTRDQRETRTRGGRGEATLFVASERGERGRTKVNEGGKEGGARRPLRRQQPRHTQGERTRQGTGANGGRESLRGENESTPKSCLRARGGHRAPGRGGRTSAGTREK